MAPKNPFTRFAALRDALLVGAGATLGDVVDELLGQQRLDQSNARRRGDGKIITPRRWRNARDAEAEGARDRATSTVFVAIPAT